MLRELAGRGLGLTAVPPSWLHGPGPKVAVARLAPGVGENGPVHRLALVHLAAERLTPVGRLLVEHLTAQASAPGRGGVAGGGHADGRSWIGGRSA